MWNSNCESTLHQVQLANVQTRHHSYTSAEKTCGWQWWFWPPNLRFGTLLCLSFSSYVSLLLTEGGEG